MREIKFRAWHKIHKKMIYNVHTVYDGVVEGDKYYSWTDFSDVLSDKDVIVEQYTGLKDKNGKEIYAGDIVKVPDDYDEFGMMSGEEREIYYKDGGFRLKPKAERRDQRGHWFEDDKTYEIIGNIHDKEEIQC